MCEFLFIHSPLLAKSSFFLFIDTSQPTYYFRNIYELWEILRGIYILRKPYVVSPFFGLRSLGWPFFIWYDSRRFLFISSLFSGGIDARRALSLWFLSIIGLMAPKCEPHVFWPTVKKMRNCGHWCVYIMTILKGSLPFLHWYDSRRFLFNSFLLSLDIDANLSLSLFLLCSFGCSSTLDECDAFWPTGN